jgi:hypothetical protein
MRKNPTPLALLALLAVGAAIMAGLVGRDRATPQRAADPRDTGQEQAATNKPEMAPSDPLLELAARYALAARNWTPATYAESWHQQLEVAGGRYRRQLEASNPGPVELGTLREDRARSRATLVRARRDPRVREPDARVLVTLNETTIAAGQTIRGPTVNQVELRQHAGRWKVVGFTVLPGGGSPGSGSQGR